jgi:hypothetical protein
MADEFYVVNASTGVYFVPDDEFIEEVDLEQVYVEDTMERGRLFLRSNRLQVLSLQRNRPTRKLTPKGRLKRRNGKKPVTSFIFRPQHVGDYIFDD